MMRIIKKLALVILWMITSLSSYAQYKVVVSNLNTKKEIELKIGEVFYFGNQLNAEIIKGTLESIGAGEINISGKSYKTTQISWIDYKGNNPKKNTSQIAKVLLYFGGGLTGVGAFKLYEDNDKTNGKIVGITGVALIITAIGFWVLPKQPKYDFSTKYFLEILPQNIETK